MRSAFQPVLCPRKVDAVPCGGVLIRRIKWPTSWQAYPVALASEAAATNRGPVKQCPKCSGFVEIVIHGRAA